MKKIIEPDVVVQASEYYKHRVPVTFRSAGDHSAVKVTEPLQLRQTVKIAAVEYDTKAGSIKLKETIKLAAVKLKPTVQIGTIKLKESVEKEIDESNRYVYIYPDESQVR